MPSEMTIIVADPIRIPAIRDGVTLPGRVMYFTVGNVASAMETVRAHQPTLVVVDAVFAQTPQGLAFVERVEKLAIPQGDIRLVVQLEGRWVTAARRSSPLPIGSVAAPVAVVTAPVVVAASVPAAAAAQAAALNTRRAPRFLVRDAVNAVVESGSASLVDISVLGAQIVSGPALRPRQKIKLALPDTNDMLHVMAQVAWSTFEKPKLDAYYRAGLEFTNAAQQALEDYRLRHCADQPIPYRG